MSLTRAKACDQWWVTGFHSQAPLPLSEKVTHVGETPGNKARLLARKVITHNVRNTHTQGVAILLSRTATVRSRDAQCADLHV